MSWYNFSVCQFYRMWNSSKFQSTQINRISVILFVFFLPMWKWPIDALFIFDIWIIIFVCTIAAASINSKSCLSIINYCSLLYIYGNQWLVGLLTFFFSFPCFIDMENNDDMLPQMTIHIGALCGPEHWKYSKTSIK